MNREKPTWLRPHGTPWVRGRSRVAYDNPWIRVTEFEATAPTGAAATYGLVSYKNLAIAILPLFDDGTTVLVGQHRFPAMDYSWEIPEGGGPLGDDPLASAKRELAEETGLAAAEWRQILTAQLSNSVSDERAIGYLATGLFPAENRRACRSDRGAGDGARAVPRGAGGGGGRRLAGHADGGDAASGLPYGPRRAFGAGAGRRHDRVGRRTQWVGRTP